MRWICPARGVKELSYSNSTCEILEFDSELIELSSSSLSNQVRVSLYPTRAALELNRINFKSS